MSDLARAESPWCPPTFLACTATFTIRTARPVQIVDVTAEVAAAVRRASLACGFANVQVLHTTTGLLLNEREPLLFEDLERTLERLAPREAAYSHDELERRVPAPPPDERRNGHAHCRAMVLAPSLTLNVSGGALVLGRWQRLLFVELDGPQPRSISIALVGTAQPEGGGSGSGW